MAWRDALADELLGVIADLEHKPIADDVIMNTLRRVSASLRADMPTPDRIAFARKLLVGTGCEIVAGDRLMAALHALSQEDER